MATVETVGAYKLSKTLGRGSYGKVKLGVHEASGKQVAVKIVAHTTEKSRRQLEREISIISKLQHPNIVQMHEVLRLDDRIYLILEYVGGGELFDYIMGRGRISEKMAVKFFRQMVSAVGYCHKNGVCHRDIKPENLILDEEGNIKINDFGLSNFFAPDTLLNSFCGSPIYAAPEIMAEKIYNGPAADVWSLGIVLYAMVVGQLPWRLDERGIICDVDDLIRARFTIPSSATISPECEDLIRRILVADPLSRIKLDDLARHPWVMKGFGYPVNFNGEGPVGSLKVSKSPSSPRKRATIAVMDHFDPSAAPDTYNDSKEQRRGSAPENFFTKLFHRKSSSPREKPVQSKEPQIRPVRGAFQLDITTTKPPDHIMQEINKALHQSKIEQTNEGFVFHCTGKVNVKGKGEEPVTSYKIKFDIELCNVAGIQGLYGLHFKKLTGSVWLFRSLSIYLIDRMKL